jgi:hypothetical protein
VFENRVLRKILGPKRDEVTGEWTTLHNEQLRILYIITNNNEYHYEDKIKENELGRACGMYRREKKVNKILVGKPEGQKPHGRPRHRW